MVFLRLFILALPVQSPSTGFRLRQGYAGHGRTNGVRIEPFGKFKTGFAFSPEFILLNKTPVASHEFRWSCQMKLMLAERKGGSNRLLVPLYQRYWASNIFVLPA